MYYVSLISEFLLVAYLVWESVRAVPRYRQLKQAIADGNAGARIQMYREVLVFEWISLVLSVGALGLDWRRLSPPGLELTGSALMQWLAAHADFARGQFIGVFAGVILGAATSIILRVLRNRRGAKPPIPASDSRWGNWLPDFSALLPVTAHERLLFAAVAISAGVCEEVVFRGWLLAALHAQLGLQGTTLLCAGAAIFGLAHAYQRVSGIVLTAILGAFFCLLCVETGSLLLPIILHAVIDLRPVLLPKEKENQWLGQRMRG